MMNNNKNLSVFNIDGIGQGRKNWSIEEYNRIANCNIKICTNVNCTNGGVIACPVSKKEGDYWYIAPICRSCSCRYRYGVINLHPNVVLVPISQFV